MSLSCSPAAAEDLCMACASSPLPDNLVDKDFPPDYVTPCCSRRICRRCLDRRPRLARYCIRCQTVADTLNSSTSTRSRISAPPLEDNAFILGESDDEYDEILRDNGDNLNVPVDPYEEDEAPPPYEPPTAQQANGAMTIAAKNERKSLTPDDNKEAASSSKGVHYIRPNDTLVGIAFEYNVDPSLLVRLNKLSRSVINLQPALLHTRSFLILPSTAKSSSKSPTPLLSEEDERIRLITRRFQVAAKCPDVGVAKLYVQRVLDQRREEAAYIKRNQLARSTKLQQRNSGDEGNGDGGCDVDNLLNKDDVDLSNMEIRKGGELDDALEAWKADNEWEAANTSTNNPKRNIPHANGKGKGKSVPSTVFGLFNRH